MDRMVRQCALCFGTGGFTAVGHIACQPWKVGDQFLDTIMYGLKSSLCVWGVEVQHIREVEFGEGVVEWGEGDGSRGIHHDAV